MKIYIDHFIDGKQKEFVLSLRNQIENIKQNITVTTYYDVPQEIKNKPNLGISAALAEIESSDIIIPIITSTYLNPVNDNEKKLHTRFDELSNSKEKYILPIIFGPSNWSSISWIVKSKVFPPDGRPIVELNEYEKDTVINDLVQTIENIVATQKKSADKVIPGKKGVEKKAEKIVFISHDHDDGDFAELLQSKLEKHEITGWIDAERLKVGLDWREEIDQGIINSVAVIAIMTPEARKSEYVTYEWAFAWGKGKKIFPIMLKQTPLHPRLESLQYLDFTKRATRPWDDLIDSIKSLLK